MTRLADKIRASLAVKSSIEPRDEIAVRVQFLVDYCLTTGARGFVLGISGGQDSTLAGRMCQMAAEKLRSLGEEVAFTAVRLPYRVQSDHEDVQLAMDFIQPDKDVDFNIGSCVDALADEFTSALGEPMSDFNRGNVKARIRMAAQYAIAGASGQLVVGSDHAAEAVTGFYTKFGDGGADVMPLSGLTKRQGRALLEEMGAPARLYEKTPTADLLDDAPGQSDEEALGVSYREIDTYLEGGEVPEDVAMKIEQLFMRSRHKRTVPVAPHTDWWIRC
ncbi:MULTISPECIES: ammonia-dependent NAD(+) synthetase [unclassified Brevibacterium]|uniref:ammonia-dependent NAD(+) synthetase n=1 Tax=unclassified Brevibacterium TaxID=2614124 RepID=UPI0008A5BB89|nr:MULTISPECIES: ammonia-dependent NAD(+) synthetase [unclassified Brevibacterium]OFL64469.1 NAD(+) synthetase [Brevibacterium sp. HMSC063G07]OFS27284.1 NAD(+) synthase [Brevibacterium sp. HMSC07C04]